jgi:imidazolonepropionase-like amidohydrolase
MNIKSILSIFLILNGTFGASSQVIPAPPQKESILITGLIIHIGNGDKLVEGAIGFENGRITYVGSAERADKSRYTEFISASGSHAYPGFIAPNSTLGLMEIEAVRATRDYREVGDYNPNVRALVAYNSESDIIPTIRSNGVLMAEICPRGGIVSGTSSVVQFDAWNWEDAAISEDIALHLNWPGLYRRDWQSNGNPVKNEEYNEEIRDIRQLFAEAKSYLKYSGTEQDLRLEAMKGLFTGEKRLFVHADDIRQITEAIQFKKEFGIAAMTLVGAYDSYLIADMVRDNNVSVMLSRVHNLPQREEEDIDLPFRLPKLLQDEGVLFCFENSGSMEQMGTRNLPFYAGTAVAYGLTYEQAVSALSLNTAKILGVDDNYGSIETGKSATFFISSGDALDMMYNDVIMAFIDGRAINLDNRQKELFRRYREKYSVK